MAEHRALQALKAIKSTLLAAGTRAGANVEIGRSADVTEADAILIGFGADVPVNEFGTDNTATIDSIQTCYVDLHVRSSEHEERVVENVYELRAQVHAALLADWTLGLPFVIAVRYQGTEEFEPGSYGDRLGSMRTLWDVAYRMQYDDPAT